MQLEFSEGLEVQLDKNCEIEYPAYVSHLSAEEMTEAKLAEDSSSRIVSAGTDPADQKILFFTAEGKIMLFDSKKYHIPDGPSFPANCGKNVYLPNVNGRWPGPVEGFSVESEWMIKKSTSALSGATLDANYKGENNAKKT